MGKHEASDDGLVEGFHFSDNRRVSADGLHHDGESERSLDSGGSEVAPEFPVSIVVKAQTTDQGKMIYVGLQTGWAASGAFFPVELITSKFLDDLRKAFEDAIAESYAARPENGMYAGDDL